MNPKKKGQLSAGRRLRLRRKVVGTADRPRMCVRFTGKHIYVQFVDDQAGTTIASASSRAKGTSEKLAANVRSAILIGQAAAQAAASAGVSKVVFDKGASRFHGKVKALADSAREAGLIF